MEIRPVESERLALVAGMLGRALSTEPMLAWPLGDALEDLADRCGRFMMAVDDPLVELGMLREVGDGLGAALWVPPERHGEFWTAVDSTIEAQRAVCDDGGRRLDRLWDWVTSLIPDEPL